MKKTIITVAFVAAFALTASAVLASSCCWPYYKTCCPEVKVDNYNYSTVYNYTKADSNTGVNTINSKYSWGGSSVSTGYAVAVAGTTNQVGSNYTAVNTVPNTGKVDVKNVNVSYLKNTTEAKANSGVNTITSGCGKATINTGDAGAYSSSVNMVGSNVTLVNQSATP